MIPRPSTSWTGNIAGPPICPESRLLLAVMAFALRDLLHGSASQAADARRYLFGPNFEDDCALLDINPARVRLAARNAKGES